MTVTLEVRTFPDTATLVVGEPTIERPSIVEARYWADEIVRMAEDDELRALLRRMGPLDPWEPLEPALTRAFYSGTLQWLDEEEAEEAEEAEAAAASAPPPGESGGVWDEIEETLLQFYNMPHNRIHLVEDRKSTPEEAVEAKLKEIRSGLLGTPVKEEIFGPRLFLRVLGPTSRAYSGEWWFDSALLDTLEKAFSRIYFTSPERKTAIRDMLREVLAVSREWNPMTEIWALAVPAGETLIAYTGTGAQQQLFQGLKLSDKANRMLSGGAKQYFFPVKNPFWVEKHSNLVL